MRISIIPKSSLDQERIDYITSLVAAPQHAVDNGPCKVWDTPSYYSNLYVVVLKEFQTPIGILYAGGPKTQIDAAWWIDSNYRDKGYGSEAVDAFAQLLKSNDVTGVGKIVIDTFQGEYSEKSATLVAKFKSRFE